MIRTSDLIQEQLNVYVCVYIHTHTYIYYNQYIYIPIKKVIENLSLSCIRDLYQM